MRLFSPRGPEVRRIGDRRDTRSDIAAYADRVGADIAQKSVLQAALLTAVNCAGRTLLGGVTVVGAAGPLRVMLSPFANLEQAVEGLGGRRTEHIDRETPTLVMGDIDEVQLGPLAMRATFAEWCGGVVPVASAMRLAETGAFMPAGVLAGALGVSEIFQRLRGEMRIAGRRGGEPWPAFNPGGIRLAA
jgi:hypothetical protein